MHDVAYTLFATSLGTCGIAWGARGIVAVQLPPFHQRVFATVRSIAPGQTRSYGEVAAAGGRSGGFSAAGGVTTKRRLLAIEGALSAASAQAGTLSLAF